MNTLNDELKSIGLPTVPATSSKTALDLMEMTVKGEREQAGAKFDQLPDDEKKNVSKEVRKIVSDMRQRFSETNRLEKEVDYWWSLQFKLPNPVWRSRLADSVHPGWRDVPVDQRIALFRSSAGAGNYTDQTEALDRIWSAHHDAQNPLFTPSKDLITIIRSSSMDQSLLCNMVQSPTPKGCYFYLPQSGVTCSSGAQLTGFYLQPTDGDIKFVMIYDDGGALCFFTPNTEQPLVEYLRTQSVIHDDIESAEFVCMLLFYCNCAQYRREERPEYSELVKAAVQKKNPAKRQKALKQANSKFDYVLISPAQPVHKGVGTGAERSPHFRRGHFRTQKYGPRWTMEKVIFIAPTFIGGAASIKNYMVD